MDEPEQVLKALADADWLVKIWRDENVWVVTVPGPGGFGEPRCQAPDLTQALLCLANALKVEVPAK